MDIQFARAADLAEVEDLFQAVVKPLTYYNSSAISNELSKYTEGELYKKIAEDPYSVIIGRLSEKLVGFCFSRMDDMLIWLEWFGVADSARKQGVARQLVAFLEETAPSRGAHKIWCDCRTSNQKSANLLSTSGYLPICTVRNHWYGQDFILWQKEITVLA